MIAPFGDMPKNGLFFNKSMRLLLGKLEALKIIEKLMQI
jgi:hypothetical protein